MKSLTKTFIESFFLKLYPQKQESMSKILCVIPSSRTQLFGFLMSVNKTLFLPNLRRSLEAKFFPSCPRPPAPKKFERFSTQPIEPNPVSFAWNKKFFLYTITEYLNSCQLLTCDYDSSSIRVVNVLRAAGSKLILSSGCLAPKCWQCFTCSAVVFQKQTDRFQNGSHNLI